MGRKPKKTETEVIEEAGLDEEVENRTLAQRRLDLLKDMKNMDTFLVKVAGATVGDISGAVPQDIKKLLFKPSKDMTDLLYLIGKKQIELQCQKGDTDAAMDAWNKLELRMAEREQTYNDPLNGFQKDKQCGNVPYMGAHCFYGAFRDSCVNQFPSQFWHKQGQADRPSDKHLRDLVRVNPNHVFFYRDGKRVDTFDAIEEQQPIGPVKGFARYEVIYHPVTFEFTIEVMAAGKFRALLECREAVLRAVKGSCTAGIGARRSANYGDWKITDLQIEEWNAFESIQKYLKAA